MICSSCGTENRPDRKFCLRCGAALAALEGRVDEAAAHYREAIRLYRELELPIQLGLCLGDQAVFLPPTPTSTAGAAEARRSFEDLGAAGLLAHLDRLGVASAGTERQVRTESSEPVG